MKHKTTQTLFAYWNAVRQDRIAPRRFEIEPSRIAGILPNTFILERIESDNFRFRLAGTSICEAFGREFRDTNFLDGWTEDERADIERLLAVVTQQGGAGMMDFEATTDGSQTAATFEIILLPLVHTRDSVDRVLGALSAVGPHAPETAPSPPFNQRRVTRTDIIWPDGRPHSIITSLHRQVPFLPHVRKARIVRSERRQFRVYDGGLTNDK